MKVLTYALYKEHGDLYTEIHDSIADRTCTKRCYSTIKGLHSGL